MYVYCVHGYPIENRRHPIPITCKRLLKIPTECLSHTNGRPWFFWLTKRVWGMGMLRVVFTIEAGNDYSKSTFIMTLIKQEKLVFILASLYIWAYLGVFTKMFMGTQLPGYPKISNYIHVHYILKTIRAYWSKRRFVTPSSFSEQITTQLRDFHMVSPQVIFILLMVLTMQSYEFYITCTYIIMWNLRKRNIPINLMAIILLLINKK